MRGDQSDQLHVNMCLLSFQSFEYIYAYSFEEVLNYWKYLNICWTLYQKFAYPLNKDKTKEGKFYKKPTTPEIKFKLKLTILVF